MEKFDDVKAYKEALLSDIYTPKMIMSNITIPEKVYKYRALNFDYLKDSLEGKVYFSLPSEINANDDDDCKVNVDEEKCIEYFMEQCNCSRVSAKEKFSIVNNHWIIGLQDKIKIGCFTTVVPSDSNAEYMWNELMLE